MKLFADFNNADRDGFVRLNTAGTRRDLATLGSVLVDGLEVQLSDGELIVDAVVVPPGAEGVWRARIDWDQLKPVQDEKA